MNEFSKLKDVSKLITKGTTPTSVGGSFTEKGINFIKSESITGSKFLNNSVFAFIDDSTDLKLKRSRIKTNDLLFSIAGAYLGKISIVQECDVPANTNQAVGIVRVDQSLADVNYLYYYFFQNSVNEYINKLSSQSSQPNLNLELLGNLEFKSRKLESQQKIATVLSALDDKIELNNQINTELEAMAKTLYDYWFVQFDFPDENGKPYQSSGGKMVFNDILKREIPEGWGNMIINDLGSVIGGSTPSKANPQNFCDNGIPWITPKDLSMNIGNKFISNGELDVSALGLKDASLNILPLNSVLMSSRAPIGYLAINRKECTTNQGFKSIVCDKGYASEYVYYVLKNNMKIIEANASGSTFKEISGSVFKSIDIIKPDKEVLSHFREKVAPIFKKQNNLEKQNQELAQLRDWLLPMLMNGQVRVGECDEEDLGLVAEEKGEYKKSRL